MAVLLFNKYKGDRVRVLLVWELREMLQALGEIMLQVKQGLLSFTIINVKGIWQGSTLSLRGQGILHDGQATQTIITHNAAFQTDDLDAYDLDYDDISLAKAVLMANLSSYDSDVLSEVPQHDTYQNDDMINQSVQETHYFEQSLIDYVPDNEITSDSNIISYEQYLPETQNAIVQDTNSFAQQDAMIIFVFEQMSNQQLSTEQAFWLPISNPKSEQLVVTQTPLEIEVPKELPKMEAAVEQCFVDKKYFDIQKKELFLDNDRFLEHIICQDVMNIIMHDDFVSDTVFLVNNNKCLVNDNLKIERLEQKNDHLFELLLSQDIVHICVNSLDTHTNCHEMQQSFIHEYNENLVLKAELAKKEHMVEKIVFNEVVLVCSRLKNHCANLELKLQHQKESFLNNRPLNNKDAPEILEFFKTNEWQAKLNAKDVSIAKLKKHIENLKGKNVVEKDLL
ncbi:hypothetical protein Tco_0744208 [Tanacetum coccineum]